MTRQPAEVALVTGGTRGIGLGIARSLAQAGYALVLCGRRRGELVEEVVRGLRELGGEVHYVPADVAEPQDRARLIEEIRQRFGRLNVLVNNAGIAPPQRRDILEAGEESFETVLRVNLQGPYFLTQSAARWMVEQRRSDPDGRAAIIFVTSVSAELASVNRGEYCISKAGLSMAARLWAVRLAEAGIPVYEVRPGIVDTDMTAGVKEKYDALISQGLLLLPRWGTPEDVGKAVRALASGELPYSTGQVILIDGGMTVGRL
ncbi:MAG: 3-ketoacyl-ACP reductase [Acidobacteriota bacterium]